MFQSAEKNDMIMICLYSKWFGTKIIW